MQRFYSVNVHERRFFMLDQKQLKKIRIKDIAEAAGVSIGTVDRVIHNRGEVSSQTKEKIMAIIKEMNYRPNIHARTLALKKTFRFGVLIPDAGTVSDYWHAPRKGIERAEREVSDFGIEIERFFFDLSSESSFKENIDKVLDSKVDALLFAPVFREASYKLVHACQQNHVPFVFIDSGIEGVQNLSSIGQDAFTSGYLAARLLAYSTQQNSTILLLKIIAQGENQRHYQKRETGFRKYISEHSASVKRRVLTVNIDSTEQKVINEVLFEKFTQNPQTEGIFVLNSKAYKVAQYFETNGKHSLCLVGYDLVPDNVAYLNSGIIDFLIGQRPEDQAYRGIMTLFNHLILEKEVNKNYAAPIDIITKENVNEYIHLEL